MDDGEGMRITVRISGDIRVYGRDPLGWIAGEGAIQGIDRRGLVVRRARATEEVTVAMEVDGAVWIGFMGDNGLLSWENAGLRIIKDKIVTRRWGGLEVIVEAGGRDVSRIASSIRPQGECRPQIDLTGRG